MQELVTDPVLNQGAAGESGDPELLNLAGQSGESNPDPEGAPAPLEEGQLADDPELPPQQSGPVTGWTINGYVAREYIWGPGDSYAGVDELLVQFDEDRKPWWVIQDGGGDVVALIETPGTSPTSTQPARVAGQWTYDAYGAVQSSDLPHPCPPVHCGHKGLFFDRLDAGVVDIAGSGTTITETPRLEPGAESSYYVRNRHYAPRLGRWLQMDPNATAMVLIASASSNGRGLGAAIAALTLEDNYGDGANLYAYLGSSPWLRNDATGLTWDPFEMVDDYLAEDTAQKMGFMEAYAGYWKSVGKMALNCVPVVGSFMYGYDLGERLVAGEEMGWMDYLTIGLHIMPLVSGAVETGINVVSKTKAALDRIRFRYAQTGIKGPTFDKAHDLIEAGIACFTCMAASTPVWIPSGFEPLGEIKLGQLVITEGQDKQRPELREPDSYGPEEMVSLWQKLGECAYRPVHARIVRRHGVTTDIYEFVRIDDLKRLGLDRFDGSNVKLWIPSTGELGSGAFSDMSAGGWAKVLSVGDEVRLSNGIEVPTDEAAPVMGVYITTRSTLLALSIEGWCEPLAMTATHPLWLDARGEWTRAGELTVGDRIRTSGGSVRVLKIEVAEGEATVYNLSVAGGHTYFVGEDRAWVHNACIGDVFKTYSEAAKFTQGKGSLVEAHHLVEARHLKNWGRNPNNGPAVLLTYDQHLAVTREIRAALPYGTPYTEAQVRAGYNYAYRNFPSEWRREIWTYMGW